MSALLKYPRQRDFSLSGSGAGKAGTGEQFSAPFARRIGETNP